MQGPQDPQRPFERDAFFDDPAIVGARWWNRAFESEAAATRRQAMKALAVVAVVIGGIAVIGIGGVAAAISHAPDRKLKKAVDVQRQLGWSVGAFEEPLAWGLIAAADARAQLARLSATLQAKRYAPFQVLTQLEAIGAVPKTRLETASYTVTDLAGQLRPVRSAELESDFARGKELAAIFGPRDVKALVIVDCEGPRSVAFAAGAATTFEPVFILDNWPHPTGVVPAHQTLGALAAFEPDLAKAAAARGPMPSPLFVLDRHRNKTVTDAEEVFDNRYFVNPPNAVTLMRWGLSRVLLIVDSPTHLPEAGDLAEALAAYVAAGVDVRCITFYNFGILGDYAATPEAFFHHVPWAPAVGPAPKPLDPALVSWRPGSTSNPSPKVHTAGFGEVYVYEKDGKLIGVPAYGGTRDRSGGTGYGG